MKKKILSFEDIDNATKVLGLIGLENRNMIKKKYLELSKKYHPDMIDGDTKKFQDINKSYKIIEQYLDDFKFDFTKEEFYNQNPYAALQEDKEWFKKKH